MCRPNCSGTRVSASGWKASTLSFPAVICRKNISNTSRISPPPPILYVHGNHDGSYKESEPGGCICVDDAVYIWKGLRIMGLGGCNRYNRDDTFQYTEAEMRRRVRKLWLAARRAGGIDILLTHAPASGLNDGTDKAHKGFQVFNDLMDQYQPKWFIHGHMHLNYGANLPRVCTRGGTTVINATERYEFEIPDPVQVPKRKLFGWG